MPAIRLENLVKNYGDVRAVDGIGFAVEMGEIFGLLGPNGAGKTTTVEIFEGLRIADSGVVEVLGMDVRRNARQVKQRIGVALQTVSLNRNMTAWELLDLFGSFFDRALSPNELLTRMGLQEKAHTRAQNLSGGQHQRLSVALALVNDPDVLFFDEPTSGLDPQARRGLWDVIVGLRDAGKTVFLTTHYIEEAERLCDRVAIIDHGRILALDTPMNLIKAEFTERAIEFSTPAGFDAGTFSDIPGVSRVSTEGEATILHSTDTQRSLAAVLDRADVEHWALGDIKLRQATLEDVFLKLTGRRIRE